MAVELHVVMLPFSAFGHIIPFFQFSVALAKAGVRVSFVSTPKIIERLPKVPSNLASLITLVPLPMPKPSNGDLPEGAEATVDIPFEKMPQLNAAYDLLQHPFQKLVADESPDWIIIDFMPHWVIEIAQERKLPVMLFSVFSGTTSSFTGPPQYLVGEARLSVRPSMESLMSPPVWVDFPSLVACKKHEAFHYFNAFYGPNTNGTDFSLAQRLAKIMNNCHAIAVRSCDEFEGPYLNLLRKIMGKPVIPIGFLPPEKLEKKEFTDDDEPWKRIFTWLDEQKPKSTVFVGFGSECKLSKEQIHEIARGLELSELPFLWALRKPEWSDDETQVLPNGFVERTRGRGIVNMGWAPQVQILGHPSIGGSLFHAGWGSMIETLEFGHSLVVLPIMADQCINARLLVEKGLAVEVEREEDGSFNGDDIAKALRMAMVLEEGEALRIRAREVAAVFKDRKLHQEHYIGELVRYMKSHKAK